MAFAFGVGVLQISATAGLVTLGKLQNISLTISTENAQLRGGTDVYAVNTQFFDGKVEGTVEYADIELSSLGRLIAGSGTFAGAGGSGTVTFTGLCKPSRVQIRLSGVTNGITSTITIDRCYFPSLTLDFNRTEYTIPNLSFVAEASPTNGALMTWVQ